MVWATTKAIAPASILRTVFSAAARRLVFCNFARQATNTLRAELIAEVPWAEAKHRLNVIDGILKNPHAGPVELQQAEEEIRLVINQLAGELNFKKFGAVINTKNMTPDKVQKTLLACGVDKGVTTKLVAAFGTVDPAHHSQADYAPSKERIREYYGRATSLAETVRSV
jgi:hypothetical protein